MNLRLPTLLCLAACAADPDEASPKPGAERDEPVPSELCNGLDDNGNGEIDEGFSEPFAVRYWDADGDGHGDPDRGREGCDRLEGEVDSGDDCNDRDANISPSAPERCNETDDDCDGAVDELEDVETPPLWQPDADGDGYGDAHAASIPACTASSGLVADGTDCNDSDPEIHPGAHERCDGVDNDCDASTLEDALAEFVDLAGERTDVSALLQGASATRVLTEPGTLELCGGTYTASLRFRADVTVRGTGVAGPSVLEPGRALPGIVLRQDGLTVSLEDLTIRGGTGVGAVLAEWTAGGGIECSGASDLLLQRVTLDENQADVGAGLFVEGCTVQGESVSVTSNIASAFGGGVAVLAGAVVLTDSLVELNVARNGAGVAVVGEVGSPTVDLLDSHVQRNAATALGGGIWVEAASLSCTDSGGGAGITANDADEGGGGIVLAGGLLSSDGCDWGSPGSVDDNTPDDLAGVATNYTTETFFCTDTTCEP